MSNELVFYTNPQSRGRTVRWMLEEVGAPYTTEVLEFGTTMKAPVYLAINPMGKVPAFRDTPYLCGDTFTAADVYVCSQVSLMLQIGTPGMRSSFEAYVARVADRDACRRAAELDEPLNQ